MEEKYEAAKKILEKYGQEQLLSNYERLTEDKKKQLLDEKVIDTMLASGLNQSISYSFVSPKVFDKICNNAEKCLREHKEQEL